MEQEKYKIGFFKRIKWAIFNLENYDLFAVESAKKAILYFIKIMLLFTCLICIGITYQFGQTFYRTLDSLEESMPNFTFQDGKLIAEETAEILSEEIGVVLVDTTQEASKKEENLEKIRGYTAGVLLLNDKLVLKLPNIEGIMIYDYADLIAQYHLQDFTKQEAIDYIHSFNKVSLYMAFYIAAFMYLFSIYVVVTLMDIFLLSILGLLTAKLVKIKLRYTPIINICIYALTLPIILNAAYILINSFTGFEIQYFQVMYNAIAYIYVVAAILMIKSEMIKQEQELMKLVEEQKKVKEEMEREKEEERQREEQKRREKEKEEKEKKQQEKEKQEKEGETPEGSSAITEHNLQFRKDEKQNEG